MNTTNHHTQQILEIDSIGKLYYDFQQKIFLVQSNTEQELLVYNLEGSQTKYLLPNIWKQFDYIPGNGNNYFF